MPQNIYYKSLRRKKPLRCENYAIGERTQIVSLWRENYASRFRGIQASSVFIGLTLAVPGLIYTANEDATN